jgi:hypothetical protein
LRGGFAAVGADAGGLPQWPALGAGGAGAAGCLAGAGLAPPLPFPPPLPDALKMTVSSWSLPHPPLRAELSMACRFTSPMPASSKARDTSGSLAKSAAGAGVAFRACRAGGACVGSSSTGSARTARGASGAAGCTGRTGSPSGAKPFSGFKYGSWASLGSGSERGAVNAHSSWATL